jgi:hypothetical protein
MVSGKNAGKSWDLAQTCPTSHQPSSLKFDQMFLQLTKRPGHDSNGEFDTLQIHQLTAPVKTVAA